MKQLFVPLLVLGVFFGSGKPTFASWAEVSEATLATQAELIVGGVVVRLEPGFSLVGGREYQYVVLNVSEVIKGEAEGEVRFVQQVQGVFPSSTDLSFDVGQEGAWFLNRNPILQNEFFVKHPSQYQPEGIVLETGLVAASSPAELDVAPEPSSLLLSVLALWGVASRRRRTAR